MSRNSSYEWYTPARYVEAAREVMGSIDLDPASCEFANRSVKAKDYFTKETNGLERLWWGKVWLNPPFHRSQTPGKKTNQGLWIQKLTHQYEYGFVEEAILLTTCRPDTSWFHALWNYTICFCDHKVGFYLPEEGQILQEHSHAHGTLFVYLGSSEPRFIEVFSKFGPIIPAGTAIKRDKQAVQKELQNVPTRESEIVHSGLD